jgi:hypothetical protein
MHWSRRGRGVKKNGANVRKKKPSYAPFRSAFEKRVSKKLADSYLYEPAGIRLDYTISHRYQPDFVHPKSEGILLEVKGYFRDASEARKYVAVKRDNPDIELIFIFNNPDKKAHPNCRPRKDGTVMTLHEWCMKEGFLYYHERELPDEILEGRMNWSWIQRERLARGIGQREERPWQP